MKTRRPFLQTISSYWRWILDAPKRQRVRDQRLANVEKQLEKLGSCVQDNPRHYGYRRYFVAGHWNDAN